MYVQNTISTLHCFSILYAQTTLRSSDLEVQNSLIFISALHQCFNTSSLQNFVCADKCRIPLVFSSAEVLKCRIPLSFISALHQCFNTSSLQHFVCADKCRIPLVFSSAEVLKCRIPLSLYNQLGRS